MPPHAGNHRELLGSKLISQAPRQSSPTPAPPPPSPFAHARMVGRRYLLGLYRPLAVSCWFDAQAERVRFVDERNEKFAACLDAAKRVMAGEIADPTGGADHYYADYIAAPKWARGRPTTRIGRHLFFRLGLGG